MIGRLLNGRYAIIENVDTGGMAYIYKAVCKKTNQIVAVKILKEDFSDNPEYVSRFKKEAEAAFSLEHPNIVHVTDIGCDHGTYYMVMEYVEGCSLKSLIEEKGCLQEAEAIEYTSQICDALEVAHSEGIIHRDIKPQNILLTPEGKAKITDFGIATSVSSMEPKKSQVLGSVYYISPEQARGEKMDHRTDIYSLGVVFYEMLTGKLPHTGNKTVAVALKHINEKVTPPAEVKVGISKAANNIVLKAMSKKPADRYRSAEAFKADLKCAMSEPDGAYVDIPKAHSEDTKERIVGRNKTWKISIFAALALLVIAAVFFGIRLFSPIAEKVRVPDLISMKVSDATIALGNLGLSANVVYESNDTVDEDIVISQSLGEGDHVSKGTAVTITVSSGPDGMVMPDLAGMSLEEAADVIESMGLSPADITYELREGVQEGKVIFQMPEADTPIDEDELISLIVSGEAPPESAPIPSLKNISVDQAVSLLQSLGFTNCLVYEQDNDAEEGTVFNQSPVEGTQTLYSDEIILYVSSYTSKPHQGTFSETLTVSEAGSKVRVVLVDMVNGVTVNFKVYEYTADTTTIHINLTLASFSGGYRTVIVYVNNVETYTYEVGFS